MLSFTIFKSKKSERYFIINSDGVELAQAVSLAQCFNYFYSWCGKLASQSVTFTRTQDSNVILVKMV